MRWKMKRNQNAQWLFYVYYAQRLGNGGLQTVEPKLDFFFLNTKALLDIRSSEIYSGNHESLISNTRFL